MNKHDGWVRFADQPHSEASARHRNTAGALSGSRHAGLNGHIGQGSAWRSGNYDSTFHVRVIGADVIVGPRCRKGDVT